MLLSTAFCPPVEYFALLAEYSSVYLEACESYCKQSWRNRCRILSANGPLDLSFPVVHHSRSGGSSPAGTALHEQGPTTGVVPPLMEPRAATGSGGALPPERGPLITEVLVDYSVPWVAKMERAIDSAYYSSPFFEFYRDALFGILDSKPGTLWELDLLTIKWLCSKFGIGAEIIPTSCWQEDAEGDYRGVIHPKRANTILRDKGLENPYWQVFGDKFGFTPGLSALDLLFNEGPDSILYLK